MSEEWRDIPGYEGQYEASSDGRIKSLARTITESNGRRRRLPERILRTGGSANYPYRHVVLAGAATWKVHQLVARAFHGLPPYKGAVVCHNDGNPLNNEASNLRWGTPTDNMCDLVEHGKHFHARKTHCPQGHEYTAENTRYSERFHCRYCRACEKERNRSRRRAVQAVAS